jgi:hypothetical protein
LGVALDAYSKINMMINQIAKPFDPDELAVSERARDRIWAKQREEPVDDFDSFRGIGIPLFI